MFGLTNSINEAKMEKKRKMNGKTQQRTELHRLPTSVTAQPFRM